MLPKKQYLHLREEAEAKISRLPLKYFDGTTTGETLSRVVNDVDNISTTLQQSLTQLITSIVTIIGVIDYDANDQPGYDIDFHYVHYL